MKKHVSKSRLAGLECLEDRRVLAANVLATGASSISAGATQDVTLTVATPDAAAGSEAVLGIEVSAASGSTLDPAALTILDTSGNAVAASFTDANATGTNSQSTVSLPAGVYTLQVSGENATAGGYQIDVSLLGDVDASDGTTGSVSTSELQTAQVAFAQTFGTGNFVTDLFNQVHGLDGSGSVDTGFDANGDGSLDADDLTLIRQNAELGTVNVDLEVDGDGPRIANSRLVTDTGISDSDKITTVPDVLVDISDNSRITTLLASVNGGTAIDISSIVGDFNATGSFLLDNADLTAINGGTPLNGAVHTINFESTDELGNQSGPVPFVFTLIDTNVNPTTTGIASQTAPEDAAFSLDISSSFDDSNAGDVLTFSAADMPSWLTISEAGVFSGTPSNADVGSNTVNVIATDSQGFIATENFQLTVTNTNDAPVLDNAIGTQNADEDDPFSLNLNSFFSDEDGDALTYAVLQATGFDSSGNFINGSQLPAWLTETNGTLSGTPSDGDGGTITIGVIALDAAGEGATDLFTINVTDLNDAPTLVSNIPDQTATEDIPYSLSTNSFFNDVDPGDTLNITATGLPAAFSISGGVISGTANDASVGTSMVTVTATDSFGTSVSDTFVLAVANVNDVPVASNQSFVVDPANANGSSVGTVSVTDDDVSETLSFAITGGNAAGIYAINSAGLITVADTAQLVEGDSQTLTVQVTDSVGATDTATISISVTSNFAPTAVNDSGFSTGETTPLVIAGSSLVANDTDPDGDTLVVGSVNASSAMGASVVLADGDVTYDASTSSTLIALGDGESATDTFTYTVSDGNGGTDTATVEVVVMGSHLVEYRLEILDSAGNVTTSVAPGETFTLVSFVEDQRPSPDTDGVFAAFMDVDYVGAATTSGNLVHSTAFPTAISGTNTDAGVLNEVGGLAPGINATGGGEMELFRQSFTAGSSGGVVTFTGNEPEDQNQRATLLFGVDDPIPVSQIVFGNATVTITTSAAAAGFVFNPNDVNGDGFVSPMDALLVINDLNGSASSTLATDVNGDGVVSPVDALLVINNLFLGSAGGNDVLTGSDSDVSEADLADALEVVFEDLAGDLQADPDATAAMLTQLDSPLIDSIYEVINADEADQGALFDSLAVDLAALLANG